MLLPNILAFEDLEFENEPYPHFTISEVFSDEFAWELYNWFEQTAAWQYTKTDFYTQFEFSLISSTLPRNLNKLNDPETIAAISNVLCKTFSVDVLNLVGITAHKLINGYKMGVHNDMIGKEETHRLIIQINPHWTDENGGYLMLFNSSNPADVSKIVKPSLNTGLAFEISHQSYHAVSEVHDFKRYTLVYTFNKP